MSHPRTRSLVLAGALVAAALAPTAATAAPKAPADHAADQARAAHERIVAYWTPERMRAAIPRDFVRQADGSFHLAADPRVRGGGNKGKPGGDGGGGTGGGGGAGDTGVPASTGSSWEPGGQVLARTGKVYFTMGSSGYVCSGAVADDGSVTDDTSLVLTAAHCVYDNDPKGSGWAQNWLFIPDFDTNPNLSTSNCASATTTYGCWTAQALVAHDGFTKEKGFTTAATQHDFAFAVVGPGGKGTEQKQLDAVVGGYQIEYSLPATARMSAFGYPTGRPYDGRDLTYCSGPLTTDPYNGSTWGLACDMTGGSSGGPWLVSEATQDNDDATLSAGGDGGTLGSLNSYGYRRLDYMFGPVFNPDTRAVFDYATEAPTVNHSVP